MKKLIALYPLLITLAVQSQEISIDSMYITLPTLAITGDFDGNGTPDTLKQFVTDSLGKRLEQLATSDDIMQYLVYPDYTGYRNAFTLNGKPTEMGSYFFAIGLHCLINLGNINNTKGDEIALVPNIIEVDYLEPTVCYIYTYCNNTWVKVFEFTVTTNAFDYENNSELVFNNIPGVLEQHNGTWMYYDYMEMEYDNPEDVGNMLPLKVGDCE